MFTHENSTKTDVLTVTQLNLNVREVLEDHIGIVHVRGEISNLATPRSGHIYFSLKDEGAQVRCAMFRGQVAKLAKIPEEGEEVVIIGAVSLYPERGDFQIIVRELEPWGLGKLQQAYEALKAKLKKAGLFSPDHKKPLPKYPNHIAIVTSATGAALQDMLNVLTRRWPFKVTVCPTQVQGQNAKQHIVAALNQADNLAADVIILGRGGGSIEDLWAFNEEVVAHAIFNCTTPVITGIGHETDVTIADFVADVRAPTPSAAAETATPDKQELWDNFAQRLAQLQSMTMRQLQHLMQHVDHMQKRLVHPQKQIEMRQEKTGYLLNKISHLIQKTLTQYQHRLMMQHKGLQTKTPPIEQYQQNMQLLLQRLNQHMHNVLSEKQQKQQSLIKQLDALSPLNTLKRGFSITSDKTGKIITTSSQVKSGDTLVTQVEDGKIESIVV